MNKILSIKHIMGFIVFAMFVLGFTTPSFALICKSGKVQCCPGGVQSCCDPIPCTSFPCQDYDISCWGGDDALISDDDIVGPIGPIIQLCTAGQKKYTASGCSYTTETCCDRGEWCSGTCKTCSSTSESRNCSGNVTNATGGTQTRSRSVTSSCGSCSYGSWGSWTGTCTCKSGYTWKNGSCQSGTSTSYTWTCSWNSTWGSQIGVIACPMRTFNQLYDSPKSAMPEGTSCTPKGQNCQSSVYAPGLNVNSDYVPFRCWCN